VPVIDVRVAGEDEYELTPVLVPATNAGVVAEMADLAREGGGRKYIGALVTNASSGVVFLLDNLGRKFPVQAGQPADCGLEPGCTWIGVMPDAGNNITAGQVTVIATVRGA
jgi:hypothetical protein